MKTNKMFSYFFFSRYFLTFKRIFRLKYRKSNLNFIILIVLFFFCYILINFITKSNTKTESKDFFKLNLNSQQDFKIINQKFKQIQDQIPRIESLIENISNDNLNFYNNRYELFKENELGNYELSFEVKKNRSGDLGKPFNIKEIKDIDLKRFQSLKAQYGINIGVSDLIPMDRSIPDLRHNECKYWHYSEILPTTSVIIVFHNEGFSTLMRTVHSVLLRSPKRFLKEVLLVDDFSDKLPLKKKLKNYILENFGIYQDVDLSQFNDESGLFGEKLGEKLNKVRLIRNSKREGLIRSRSRGAEEAIGDVILFLDAHCEVNYNWLPPLLSLIKQNKKTLTVPLIDGINSDNFEYKAVYSNKDIHFKGIWEWGLYYKEIQVDMNKHLKTHKVSEPYDSPTHAGGLFAIDRKYFLELGGYDPGLLVWGGENFELSFKVWQCGGQLKWVPCSRVGHIYREFMPYSFGSLANERKGPLIKTNYKRVVEVWWDEQYKEFFYTREPLATFYDEGDITKQLEMKNRLQCKSFDYFMNKVGKDVYKHFPKLPKNKYWGEVRSIYKNNFCLDTFTSKPYHEVILSNCHSSGGNQLLRLNIEGQLGVGERCLDAQDNSLIITYCKLGTVDGFWEYSDDNQRLYHKQKDMCLDINKNKVFFNNCNNELSQKWQWRKIKPDL